MCRNLLYSPITYKAVVRRLKLRSLDHSNQDFHLEKDLEFVGLVADCIAVILAEFEEFGLCEDEALLIAANYIAEVVPILNEGPWPSSVVFGIQQASSRSELEAAAIKLRKLAIVQLGLT